MKTTGIVVGALISVLTLAQPVKAQWTTNGPTTGSTFYGEIDDLVTFGFSLYAASFFTGGSSGALFRTVDNGQTWTNIDNQSADAVAFTATPADRLFVANSSYVERGDADGPPPAWTILTNDGAPHFVLKVAPGTDTLYVGSSDPGGLVQMYVNAVGPGTSKRTGLPAMGNPAVVKGIAIDPGTSLPSLTMYAGLTVGNIPTQSAAVYKSTNGGNNWSLTGFNMSNVTVSDLVLDPAASGTLYLGTNGTIYKTMDGGTTWNTAMNGISGAGTNDVFLLISPANHLNVYAGIGTKIYKSVDGGANWADATGNFSGTVHSIAADPTGTVVHVGDTSGKVWTQVYCCGCA